MTITSTFLSILRRSCVVGTIVGVGVLVGPANAHKDPVTQEQLDEYNKAFMEMVNTGDLLFHGDAATAKKMGVNLSDTGMVRMCIPWAEQKYKIKKKRKPPAWPSQAFIVRDSPAAVQVGPVKISPQFRRVERHACRPID